MDHSDERGSRQARRAAALRAGARVPYLWARGLWRRYRERRLRKRLTTGPELLAAFAKAYPEAFFIEIGANDGYQYDNLRPFIISRRWRGIMVEPVPYVFERLRRNYAGLDRVVLENAAIGDRDGRVPFYHLAQVEDADERQLPGMYDAIGSFSRETVLRHAGEVPDLERLLVCSEVPCLSFESLCRKHDVGRVDLLLIDTEGYDHEIIKQIDFDARRPRMLVYEHYHLSAAGRAECRSSLQQLGYETMEVFFDTWCLDARPADRLTRRWRRMVPGLPAASVDDNAGERNAGGIRAAS